MAVPAVPEQQALIMVKVEQEDIIVGIGVIHHIIMKVFLPQLPQEV